ncbi:MAG: hypothetical protein WAU05_15910, partial [Nitrospira sp.]
MEERFSFLDPQGHRVTAILTVPDGGTDKIAILCHGFLSSKTSSTNNALTRMLIDQGIATFRFDFFGQGESEGPFEQVTTSLAVEQAQKSVDLMRERGYRLIGLM